MPFGVVSHWQSYRLRFSHCSSKLAVPIVINNQCRRNLIFVFENWYLLHCHRSDFDLFVIVYFVSLVPAFAPCFTILIIEYTCEV